MKIHSIETFSNKSVCFTRLRTDQGREGIGQTSVYNADITAQVLHRQIAPHVLGKDPGDIRALISGAIENEYKTLGSYVCRAATGVDTALWDLKGKLEGTSVCELWGGKPAAIKVYGSSMKRDIPPELEAARCRRLMETHGIEAFKLHAGKPNGRNEDTWPGRTEQVVRAVRKAIGDKPGLYVDVNGCYSVDKAVEMARFFKEQGVDIFEEPCRFWDIEDTARVRQAVKGLGIKIAGGEQDCIMAQWQRIVNIGMVDIAQPDICYIGGFDRAMQVAEMTRGAGMLCTPHCANISMILVFSLHFMAALRNPFPYLEYCIEDSSWEKDLYFPRLEVRNGEIALPDGPGWGVTLNPEWLAKAEYRISSL